MVYISDNSKTSNLPKVREPDRFYDDIYFDSDEEEMVLQGISHLFLQSVFFSSYFYVVNSTKQYVFPRGGDINTDRKDKSRSFVSDTSPLFSKTYIF
jgi:hypothetical protein